jgi:hypothetical protein
MLKRNKETLSSILGRGDTYAKSGGADLFSFAKNTEETFFETFRGDKAEDFENPLVVIAGESEIENFFIAVNTYHQEKSPITALIHVLDDDLKLLISQKSKVLNSRGAKSTFSFRRASIGLAIGEAALAAAVVNENESTVPYAACRRTLSFSLCRGTLLFGSKLNSHVLAQRWIRLRKMTGLPVSEAGVNVLTTLHDLISGKPSNSDAVNINIDLVHDLSALDSNLSWSDDAMLPTLLNIYPAIASYLKELEGPFDTRITFFNKLVDAIKDNSHGVRNDEIAIAFACNRILPGSFSHVGVLLKLADSFPLAILWYGMFSALNNFNNSKIVSPGLVAKLERDLIESFSFEQRPKCDISLQELDVISRVGVRSEVLKPSQQRAILVSIYPGIDIYTRLAIDNDSVITRSKKDVELNEMHRRVTRLLDEAAFLIKRAGESDKGYSQNKRFSRDGY